MKSGKCFDFSAEIYDLLYKDKDYMRETDFIEQIFSTYGKPKSVLEVGCGTGNYTRILQQRGYAVSGLDISEKMVDAAKKKCGCLFHVGDARRFNLGQKFDVCVALFAVMGYMTEDSDVKGALQNIHAHLKQGGLFVFDVWNGLAVMSTRPEVRVKEVENGDCKIIRVAQPTLKPSTNICIVDFTYTVLNKRTQIQQQSSECHNVRFFFPQEISLSLEQAGFEVLKICPFLDFSGKVDQSVWNMTVVARAV